MSKAVTLPGQRSCAPGVFMAHMGRPWARLEDTSSSLPEAEATVLCRPRASEGEAEALSPRPWPFPSCTCVHVRDTATGVSWGWS